MAPSTLPDIPAFLLFRPTDRQIIGKFLGPMAIHGEDCTHYNGDIIQGVDVFSVRPDALPFESRHVRDPGHVLVHFFGDQPTGSRGREVPGLGAWLPCGGGGERAYCGGDGDETVAYRRKFEFCAAAEEEADDRRGPRWRMKEYRLNKDAAAFRRAREQPNPRANMDCVVRVVYTKVDEDEPRVCECEDGQEFEVFEDGHSDEDQPAAAATEGEATQ